MFALACYRTEVHIVLNKAAPNELLVHLTLRSRSDPKVVACVTCDIVVLHGLGAGLAGVQHPAPRTRRLRQLEAQVAQGRHGVWDLRVRRKGRTAGGQLPGMVSVLIVSVTALFSLP